MKEISKILKVSIWKTVCFNFFYFPFLTAIKFPVLIARNFRLKQLQGIVELPVKFRTAGIRLGFGDMGHFDTRTQRGIWQNNGVVKFKGDAFIGLGSCISVNSNGVLEMGANFNITAKSTILVHKNVSIGNDCLLSWDILIMDTDFHPIFDQDDQIINASKEVRIGHHVWIGCQSLILKGSLIANGCVIGAGSKISGHLNTENSIYAGEPLVVKRSDIRWGN